MIIHYPETGQSFELEHLQSSSRVEEIQDVLAPLTGIPKHEQLLIAGADIRLDPNRSIDSLPLGNRPIFLFNKQRIHASSPPPPRQEIPSNVETVLPTSPPLPQSTSLFQQAWDPAVRSLPTCESQFRFNSLKGHAIFTASQNKIEVCKKLASEMHVQEMALNIVRDSTENLYRSIENGYNEFQADFQRQSRSCVELIEGFKRDMDRLRAAKLHPSLRTESRRTLLDCVNEDALRNLAQECDTYHRQLCSKVGVLASEYNELKRSVDSYLGRSSPVNLLYMENTLEDHLQYKEELATILQSLRKDVTKVKKLMDDCADGRYTSSHVQDTLLALGPMHDVQVSSHLPRMEECDIELRKLLQLFVDAKNEMSLSVHQRMQSVGSLQSRAKDIQNDIGLYREAMLQQEKKFKGLRQARKVASSYKACLAEIVRRKSYMKLYCGQAGQLAEKMARKRDNEIARREEFSRIHAVNLPHDLITAMGLYEVPSQCVVNIAPFDTNLPEIDIQDVERLGGSYTSLEAENYEEGYSSLEEITGTSNLEVENARLKAQLAASVAIICSLDSNFRPESLGEEQILQTQASPIERTMEALRLQEEHSAQLMKIITEKKAQCDAYEARIKELEERLREESSRSVQGLDAMVSSGNLEVSGVTGEGHKTEEQGTTVEEVDTGVKLDQKQLDLEDEMLTESIKLQPRGLYKEEQMLSESTKLDTQMSTESEKLQEPQDQEVESDDPRVQKLRMELETSLDMLRQCQVNSAYLENRLREVREEAKIHLCAADRRAAEYNVLRTSSVRLRGLLERLRNCVASPVGGASGFAESLRTLSASLASDAEDDVAAEFNSFISILADRVTSLAQQRAELMERCAVAEKEAESKADMAKSLFTKCKLEKQASKEKISLTRFQVHELALFVPNGAGHYEAVNWKCPNYFLSQESVALFCEQFQGAETRYILGQIVHIERCVVSEEGKSKQNPFDLDVGIEYYVVTLALVPGLMYIK